MDVGYKPTTGDSMRRALNILLLLLLLIFIPRAEAAPSCDGDFCLREALLLSVPVGGQKSPSVYVLHVEGPIVPVVASFVERGLDGAERAGAPCVIRLNTPGGLYETTQKIVTRMVNARVPVIVYVAPSGGWAASAGTFITMAAHVAAMAPGTRIGAAHPVAVQETEVSETQGQKITEDAAAWIRSLAILRGRNAALAEAAVRESRSYTDTEALEQGLVDVRAGDLPALLDALDGRTVTLAGGQAWTLRTAGAEVRTVPMSWSEQFLHTITNPNVAYLLLTLGAVGLMTEFYYPGAVFPGVAGALSLLLGLYALGTLNAYWGGLLLMLLAFGLFLAEIFATTHGVLGGGGLAAFVLGSMLLFSGGPPGIRVSVSLIIVVALSLGAFFAFLVGAAVRAHRRRVETGSEGLCGRVARTLTPLDPEGLVLVEGERWAAREETGATVPAGEEVVVTGTEGLRLKVKRRDTTG
jgi:membrane-bound serine protease (ClpP class)